MFCLLQHKMSDTQRGNFTPWLVRFEHSFNVSGASLRRPLRHADCVHHTGLYCGLPHLSRHFSVTNRYFYIRLQYLYLQTKKSNILWRLLFTIKVRDLKGSNHALYIYIYVHLAVNAAVFCIHVREGVRISLSPYLEFYKTSKWKTRFLLNFFLNYCYDQKD